MTKAEREKYSYEAVHRGFLVWKAGGTEREIDAAIVAHAYQEPPECQTAPGQAPPALAYLRKRASEKAATTAAVNAAIERFSE